MDEARVVINLKEGVIEIQGPVDFVRHYFDLYQPAIKKMSVSAGRASALEKAPRGRRAGGEVGPLSEGHPQRARGGLFRRPALRRRNQAEAGRGRVRLHR